MKKLIFLLITLSTSFSYSQNVSKLDEKYGFRDALFESMVLENDSTLNCHVRGDNKICFKTDENLKIGDYSLSSISYNYYKDQLYSIMIKTEGYANSRGVLGVLQKAYGVGVKNNRYIEKYVWSGKKVFMVYDENSISNSATIIIQSLILYEKKRKEEADTQAKAVDDL